jgi:RNA polymerase sigma-70 factor (ECF subfamily)
MAAVMDLATEQRYLDECRRGKVGAFRYLVDAHFAQAVRVAGALVGGRDAEDVAQDAFVAAYGAIATHEPGRPFYPWLRGILVNRAKVFIRSRNRTRARVAAVAERPGHWTAPERGAAPRTGDVLRRALEDVNTADRELLVLKHVEGYTYDELAEYFGVPRGTLMSRLYRARRRLKERILELDPTLIVAEGGTDDDPS